MFIFDTQEDPILAMKLLGRVEPTDEAAYLEALTLIARRTRRFGLISVVDVDSGCISQETRRAQSIWFKENRPHLARLCFGLVRVRPKVDPAQKDDEAFRRAMPFPSVRVALEEEARPILEAWRVADLRPLGGAAS